MDDGLCRRERDARARQMSVTRENAADPRLGIGYGAWWRRSQIMSAQQRQRVSQS